VASQRPLSADEVAVVHWLLENACTGGGTAGDGEVASHLRVVGRCACGCGTIDFMEQGRGAGAVIIADAMVRWPDGARAGVILWSRDGELSSLEVYDCTPGVSTRPLTPDLLRTYESGEL
jgi:hypothetical protein